MVRAILQGRKTQTRRVLKYQPEGEPLCAPEFYNPLVVDRWGMEQPGEEIFGVYGEEWGVKFPYGQPGDFLWVRERWAHDCPHCDDINCGNIDHIWYHADEKKIVADSFAGSARWRPSIHMPRWASRLLLEIVGVRVQQVQDISPMDCIAEGIARSIADAVFIRADEEKSKFRELWDSINAIRGFGWNMDPWVWVIEFRIKEKIR